MGDIGTHAIIYEAIKSQFVGTELEKYSIYFEFGNFLTDISQFRDPPSFEAAKLKLYNEERASQGTGAFGLWLADFPLYLEELLGGQGKKSRFASFLEHLFVAFKITEFAKKGIPENKFVNLFEHGFTQYWFHEHLDLPPCGVSNFFFNTIDGTGLSKTYTYLNLELDYVAEGLAQLEYELAHYEEPKPILMEDKINWDYGGKQRAIDLKYQKLMMRFGHLSHAVEDFFFHSNFVEINFLEQLKKEFNSGAGTVPSGVHPFEHEDFRKWYEAKEIKTNMPFEGGYTPIKWKIKDKRHFFRRILPLYPHCKDIKSRPLNYLYTGGFAENDVNHTLFDGLEGMEERYKKVKTAYAIASDPGKTALEPFDYVFIEDKRKELISNGEINKKKVSEVLLKHIRNIKEKIYLKELLKGYELAGTRDTEEGKATKTGIAYFNSALDLDQEFRDKPVYDWVSLGVNDGDLLGVFGALLLLSATIQLEHEKAAKITKELDDAKEIFGFKDPKSPKLVQVEKNKSSLEDPGTHTLLAKDSVRKSLMRFEALECGKFVARAVTAVFMERLTKKEKGKYVDWKKLLVYFLNHPDNVNASWVEKALRKEKPAPADYNPGVSYISVSHQTYGKTVSQFRSQKKLEEEYKKVGRANRAKWLSGSGL